MGRWPSCKWVEVTPLRVGIALSTPLIDDACNPRAFLALSYFGIGKYWPSVTDSGESRLLPMMRTVGSGSHLSMAGIARDGAFVEGAVGVAGIH